MTTSRIAALHLCLSIVLACESFGQAGTLDPAFGTAGVVITDMAVNVGGVNCIIVRPDGRIVASGIGSDSTDMDFALAQYLPDGTLDPSFGNGGRVKTKVTTGEDELTGMVMQPDQKIVVAGTSDKLWYPDPCIARYLPNGDLDPTFGSNGIVRVDLGPSGGHGKAIALQPNGKLVVAGFRYVTGVGAGFILIRLDPDGTLDTGFGIGGVVTTHVANEGDVLVSVLIQPDGKILAGGHSGNAPDRTFALARYMPDGSLDPGFGTDGIVLSPVSPIGSDAGWSVALRPDGSIMLGGTSQFSSTEYRAVLLAFTADGDPDVSFSSDGVDFPPYPTGYVFGHSVLVQPDGKILFTGRSWIGGQRFSLCRYMPDGNLDPDFGTGGLVSTNVAYSDEGCALALDMQGSVVVGGYSSPGGMYPDFAVLRYLNDLGIGIVEQQANTITLFPNPAAGWFNLSVPTGALIDSIALFAATGELVATYPNGVREVSLANVRPGVHALRIAGPQFAQVIRVVVQ